MVGSKGNPCPFSAQSCWFPVALEPRVSLLLMALQAMGAAWMVEQPVSSLAFYHPRLREILRNFAKVWSLGMVFSTINCHNKMFSTLYGIRDLSNFSPTKRKIQNPPVNAGVLWRLVFCWNETYLGTILSWYQLVFPSPVNSMHVAGLHLPLVDGPLHGLHTQTSCMLVELKEDRWFESRPHDKSW